MELKPTVYAVDNDHSTTNFVRNLAEKMNLECKAYTSGLEFLETFDGGKPGCLILAVRIADISGPQIQRHLITRAIDIPVIFVTGHATVPVIVRVMREGALSVLEKPIVEQELWDKIQEALRLDNQQRQERQYAEQLKTRFAAVTAKEHMVLELLLEGKTNKDIAKELEIAIRTVELRRNGLMKKLEARSLVELVQIGMSVGNGFSLCPNPHLCSRYSRHPLYITGPNAKLSDQDWGNG